MENKTFALQALRFWFDASTVAVGPGQSAGWANVVDFYSKNRNVNFFNDFGATVRKYKQSRVKSAMEKLGRDLGYTYPDKTDFFTYLAKEVSTPDAEDIKDATYQGLVDSKDFVFDLIGKGIDKGLNAAKGGIMVYAAIAAIGAFVLPKLLAEKAKKSVGA